MSVAWGPNLSFEGNFLASFGKRNGVKVQFVPNTRLDVYRQVLKEHSPEPELLEVDVVWPSILADDLLDLTPYVKDQSAFAPRLLDNYRVHGRLVALPVYVDLGVLYYRPDLLGKYGYRKPPATWDELTRMARTIQDGERRAGNKDFWGYVWQGSASEGGTCNALELQASFGGGTFIEPSGTIHLRSRKFVQALNQATNWIGTISPPAEYVYREDDSANLWNAGQVAFMRNWASGYGLFAAQPGKDQQHFGVAPLPAGPDGAKGTLGGMGVGVSKYSADLDLAIKALLELTSESTDLQRLMMTNGIPTHTSLMNRADVKSRSSLLALSSQLMCTLVSRPALVVGDKYEEASLEYATSVNSVLRRRETPDEAMAKLEKTLHALTGLPVEKD